MSVVIVRFSLDGSWILPSVAFNVAIGEAVHRSSQVSTCWEVVKSGIGWLCGHIDPEEGSADTEVVDFFE
jgi:hypothetical protein